MQSDHKKTLYTRLGHIAKDVEHALLSQDYQGIESLLSDHQSIMDQIMSEEPVDPELKPVIEEAEKNVHSLISRIRDMQNEIKKQLSTMNKKKLIHSAYNV